MRALRRHRHLPGGGRERGRAPAGLLRRGPLPAAPGRPEVAPIVAAVLELREVSVRYGPACPACERDGLETSRCPACGTVWACRRVSFDVEPGEVLGVVGESGSGKSTLLAAANLDLRVTSGTVWIGGEEVTGLQGAARRRRRAEALGIVYQTPQQGLDLELTAGGNIASRLLGAGWRAFEPLRARAQELYTAMELPEGRLDEETGSFSGGMRQRVQLARALATSPPVLLLDEPTSGLDVSVQARILDLVRRVQLSTGVAMVVVSHDLAVIRMLAGQLLVMRQGRVVERGLTDQILGDPQHPYTQLLVGSQLT
ncbi:MAG: ATP-binding cassette domain-containing protein [Candidatus Dormibacteraeota bacterium]|nr:ATP-binding cassette domain-containing protein [Candidatus Dormibacteraeota bacterium]